MLLIVKLPQEQVIAAVETRGLIGSIGPTSASGWTALWSPEAGESGLSDRGVPYFTLVETGEGLQMDVLLGTGENLHQAWLHGKNVEGIPSERAEVLATGLTELFESPDQQRDLVDLLVREPFDPEELAESLGSVLELPELYELTPEVAVVTYRGAHKIARFAATIVGPALVRSVADGWSILLATGEDEDRSSQLAAGVSGAAGRNDPVFLLWRDGATSGWSLWKRGFQVADGSWNARWRFVDPDPTGAEEQTVRCLVKAISQPIDETLLRALLRRKRSDRDPLAELVALLGLPMDLLAALDDLKRFAERAGVEDITKTSVSRAVLKGARGGFDADTPAKWPFLSTVYALATVVAAVVCVAMTTLGISVLATNGAVVEQVGTSHEDWVSVAVFGALSLILIPAGVLRIRRARRSHRT